jgi:hypothetical protein
VHFYFNVLQECAAALLAAGDEPTGHPAARAAWPSTHDMAIVIHCVVDCSLECAVKLADAAQMTKLVDRIRLVRDVSPC